jgi:hypothetical protein
MTKSTKMKQAELVQDKKSGCWSANDHSLWQNHTWVCNICQSNVIGGLPKIIGINGVPTLNCSECFTEETGIEPQWICCSSDYDKVPVEHYCECKKCTGI